MLDRQIVLEAAVRCRHVLVLDQGRPGEQPRLLLGARGKVLSTRDLVGLSDADIETWIRAHAPLARSIRQEQSELDAASVLEGWIRYRGKAVRWTSVPPDLAADELRERVQYVVREDTAPEPLAV